MMVAKQFLYLVFVEEFGAHSLMAVRRACNALHATTIPFKIKQTMHPDPLVFKVMELPGSKHYLIIN